MNKLPRNLGASRADRYWRRTRFSLGGLSIRPSLREVGVGGQGETVEPRVMQVLVALVRAEGSVVSRDRLIEQCWGGRLVGDDAINSCVAKVRALAALTSPSAFEIETIPRVGYRLHARGVARDRVAARIVPVLKEKHARLPWRMIALAAGAVAIIAIVVAAIFFSTSRPREWVIVESRLAFIATPLVERNPTFSPDGTMIAYTAGVDLANRKIYLRLRSGGDPIQLTHDSLGALSPAWSPDGSTIAYVAYEYGKPCRIMLIAVPAGSSRQVGRCRTSEFSFPAWDHGGHALFFVDSAIADEPEHIFRLDLDSGKTSELTPRGNRGGSRFRALDLARRANHAAGPIHQRGDHANRPAPPSGRSGAGASAGWRRRLRCRLVFRFQRRVRDAQYAMGFVVMGLSTFRSAAPADHDEPGDARHTCVRTGWAFGDGSGVFRKRSGCGAAFGRSAAEHPRPERARRQVNGLCARRDAGGHRQAFRRSGHLARRTGQISSSVAAHAGLRLRSSLVAGRDTLLSISSRQAPAFGFPY